MMFPMLSNTTRLHFAYKIIIKSTEHFLKLYIIYSQAPYSVNMLIGGFDDVSGGQLYYIDYLAAALDVPYAAHGYGGILSCSILDRYYKKGLLSS